MSSSVDKISARPRRAGETGRAGPHSGRRPTGRRRHDAQASRRALLDAASRLFDERGYEATTVREIGEQAHVDPALIARYFGSKEGLYLAALAHTGTAPLPSDPLEAIETILTRSETQGIGPLPLAMVSPTLTDAVRDQIRDIIRIRVVDPLVAELAGRGVADAELRAELLFALALGVALTRSSATLPRLTEQPIAALLRDVEPLVDALQTG
jgi:AcrR family transcriptional regulator